MQSKNYLKDQLRNSKIFLSMCVHDLKNPTTSIFQGLQMTASDLNQINKIYKDHVIYSKKCEQLHKAKDEAEREDIGQISVVSTVKMIYKQHTK